VAASESNVLESERGDQLSLMHAWIRVPGAGAGGTSGRARIAEKYNAVCDVESLQIAISRASVSFSAIMALLDDQRAYVTSSNLIPE